MSALRMPAVPVEKMYQRMITSPYRRATQFRMGPSGWLVQRGTGSTRPAALVFDPTSPRRGSRSDVRHYSPSPGTATIWVAGEAGLTSKPHRDRRREVALRG